VGGRTQKLGPRSTGGKGEEHGRRTQRGEGGTTRKLGPRAQGGRTGMGEEHES
jgi:hypothetical protein